MDVLTAIKNRRSVRSYSSRPIPPEVLEHIRQALHLAPSACNFQPWHFIFVTDAELRRQVAHASHEQMWMADAPLIIAAVGFPDEAYQHMGGRHNSVTIDLAIAFDHMMLTAVAEGLGTCWIGAFEEEAMMKLLNIPENARLVALSPLGYPAEKSLIAPITQQQRKAERTIFSANRFMED